MSEAARRLPLRRLLAKILWMKPPTVESVAESIKDEPLALWSLMGWGIEDTAKNLLLATREATEVRVSVADLRSIDIHDAQSS
jgi:hypothetical protein